MNDVSEEAAQEVALVTPADDHPAVLDPREGPDEEWALMDECEYCGHFPCACGG